MKLISKNKKAFFNYSISESYEAGIVLTGAEVKSIRGGHVDIQDAYVKPKGEELWLWNANVPKYQYNTDKEYDPYRDRKLLLHTKEVHELLSKSKQGRMTIIPLKIYLKNNLIKLEIGLAKGKKQYEKKAKVRERDLNRELHSERKKYGII